MKHSAGRRKSGVQTIVSILLGYIAATAYGISLDDYSFNAVAAGHAGNSPLFERLAAHLLTFFGKAGQAFRFDGMPVFIVSVAAIAYAYNTLIFGKKTLRDSSWVLLLSAIGGTATVFAESFYKTNSWYLVFGSKTLFLLASIKCFGISVLEFLAISIVDSISLQRQEEGVDQSIKPFIAYVLVIAACWLPYIISLYPASVVTDVSDQIAQVCGVEEYCWTARHTLSVSNGLLLNNHHPVAHTLLIGLFVRIGGLIGSYSRGLFLYALLQCTLLGLTAAYQSHMLLRLFKSPIPSIGSLLFFAVNPLFPIWGMTIDKDVYHAIATWWLVFMTYRILCSKESLTMSLLVRWSLLALLWMLLRNGMIYVCICAGVVMLCQMRRHRNSFLKMVTALFLVGFIYQVGIQRVLFGSLSISGGGKQEALSVPFMQTARLARDCPESISAEDRRTLQLIFSTQDDALTSLAQKYDDQPTRADGVKFLFDNEKGDQYLSDYLVVWVHGLISNPDVYAQALMTLDYGWIYRNNRESVLGYTDIAHIDQLASMLPGFHDSQNAELLRKTVSLALKCFSKLPVASTLCDFSFYTWVSVLATLLLSRRKRANELASLSFILFNYGICFLGPVACLRYALPAIVAFPTLVCFSLMEPSS